MQIDLYNPALRLTWSIEGVTNDGSNALLLVPRSENKRSYPPYHLLCILDEDDPCVPALSKFSISCGQGDKTQEYENILNRIVARLDTWSSSKKFRPVLRCTTIGSRVHVPSMSIGSQNAIIWIAPNIALEERYLSPNRLLQLWSSMSLSFPPTLDFEELQTVTRLHDSVSLVLLPNGEMAIFKGAVTVISRMYHELRELLRMPHHPNVIAKPTYLVTRSIRKTQDPVVCGFILEYHSGGTLLDKILHSSEQIPITLNDKMKWIRQIIAALKHIHGPGGSFYPELRPENLVLSKSSDIILVDFEQFGSHSRWLHPLLSKAMDRKHSTGWESSPINPACMPQSIFYSNPPAGYLVPFANASEIERQTFENYSLAKVMWCIFEEQTNSITTRDGGDIPPQSNKTPLLFPQFMKTPDRMRYWIWLCTRSSPEWGKMMCKCDLRQPDMCKQVGATLQTDGITHVSVKDAEEYFRDAVKDEL